MALGALGAALLIAVLAVAGAFSGGGGNGNGGASPAAGPSSRTPANTEVARLLQDYANRYGAQDAAGLGQLFAADGVRRDGSGPPETPSQAVAAYRRQFAQLSNPSYRLSGLRMETRPGAATVTGRYTIASSSGSTSGSVVFQLVERSGRLAIRRLELKPD